MFFAGIGGAWFDNQPSSDPCTSSGYKFYTSSAETCAIPIDYVKDAIGQAVLDSNGNPQLIFGPPHKIDGFRLKDGRASYGVGLETFALGFPIHFDWSWRTTFNKDWESVVFSCASVAANGSCVSGATDFRKPRFAVWIGYDF